jgi:lysophospholipase
LQEDQLEQKYSDTLVPFFQDRFEEFTFEGLNRVQLRGVRSRDDSADKALLVLGGRTEFVEKYAELFFDLYSQDMTIYSYDHRGQGMSGRPLADPHKGHVEDFAEYVEDLKIFCDEVIGRRHSRVFILAHSMGCAVTALFLERYQDCIAGAIFSAPMFAINCSPIPGRLMGWIAGLAVRCGQGSRYIPKGGPYLGTPSFPGNVLTASKARFALHFSWIEANPALALGSPTFGWLLEAMRSSAEAVKHANRVKIPVLILQAGMDSVVTPAAQKEFCCKAPRCSLRTIAGARHELLMEKDSMRDEVLSLIQDFLGDPERN